MPRNVEKFMFIIFWICKFFFRKSKLKFIVEVFCTSLIALAAGKCGIDELLDQIYAQFYYKKYCFIKDGLEKQRASIIRNA
jgi:hypothetical protein